MILAYVIVLTLLQFADVPSTQSAEPAAASQPVAASDAGAKEASSQDAGGGASAADSPPKPVSPMDLALRDALQGRYDEAEEAYRAMAAEPSTALAAACAWTFLDLQRGTYSAGIERLETVKDVGEQSADWHAAIASLQLRLGRYDEAVTHLREALNIDRGHYRARLMLGAALETLGLVHDAEATYKLFDKVLKDEELPADSPAEKLVELGLGGLRYYRLTQDESLTEYTQHIHGSLFQDAYVNVDPLYWPARLAAAELLLSQNNLAEARAEFQEIMSVDPGAWQSHAGLARVALMQGETDAARIHAEKALVFNPSCEEARVILAEAALAERRPAEAVAPAEAALSVNPRSVGALATLATARGFLGDKTALNQTLDRIASFAPKSAQAHLLVGKYLAANFAFDFAEMFLTQAVEWAPYWDAAHLELGLLYADTGRLEAAAGPVAAAFERNQFNMLADAWGKQIKELSEFETLKTPHFVIRYKASPDAVAPPYFEQTLEAAMEEWGPLLGGHVDGTMIVEIHPSREKLETRLAGRPFDRNGPACNGRVLALSSYSEKSEALRVTWSHTLRIGVMRLLMIRNGPKSLPAWLADGLPQFAEAQGLSWADRVTLSEALRRGWRLTIPHERTASGPAADDPAPPAALEHALFVAYLREQYGVAFFGDLLTALRKGDNFPEFLESARNTSIQQTESRYAEWILGHVREAGLPTEALSLPEELESQLKERPDDAGLLARLSESTYLRGDKDAAETLARQSLRRDPRNVLALMTLCRVSMDRVEAESSEAARRELVGTADRYMRRLIKVDPKNPLAMRSLARIEQEWQQWREAADWLVKYQEQCPADPESYRRLAAIYEHENQPDEARAVLERLVKAASEEATILKRLATLEANAGKKDKAVDLLNRAIQLDLYDVETHGLLADLQLEAKKPDEAIREYQAVCDLRPDAAIGYEGLARAYEEKGDTEKAAAMRQEAARLQAASLAPPAEEGNAAENIEATIPSTP